MEAQNKILTDDQKEEKNMLVVPYYTLRNILGFVGLALPFFLMLSSFFSSGHVFKFSFSDYYYSWIGDFIIVLLAVQGTILITYNGYNKSERNISTLAGIFAILIAVFPTAPKNLDGSFTVHTVPREAFTDLHNFFALAFFFLLAWMSVMWFTKTKNCGKRDIKFFINILIKRKSSRKDWKNFIHLLCGFLIFICLVIMVIYIKSHKFKELFGPFPVIFCGEGLAFAAYSISWLIKGRIFIKDK